MKTVGYAEALSSKPKPEKAGPKEIREISIEKAKNGGHTVTHRFHNNGPGYHEAETHVFGEGQGKEMLAHVAKHMGVSKAEKAEEAAEGEE